MYTFLNICLKKINYSNENFEKLTSLVILGCPQIFHLNLRFFIVLSMKRR